MPLPPYIIRRVKYILILIVALTLVVLLSASRQTPPLEPSEAVTTFHVSKPRKAGVLKFKVQIKDKDKHATTPTDIIVNVPLGMTRSQKLAAIKDALGASYPPSQWNLELTSVSLSMSPTESNADVGRIKIRNVVDKSEEKFGSFETPDFLPSSSDLQLEPIPLGFFPESAMPPPTWMDWIVFELVGLPSGLSSDGLAGYVGVVANDLEIIVPTAGLTKNEILDQMLSNAADYPEFVAAVDYSTGRLLLLSDHTIYRKGLGSRDSGLDIEYEAMPAN